MEIDVSMCGYLDGVVPVHVQYTRTILRRYSYVLYWVEPIDRYGYQTAASDPRAHVCERSFWTLQAAQQHARVSAEKIRERVAREADYYDMGASTGDQVA